MRVMQFAEKPWIIVNQPIRSKPLIPDHATLCAPFVRTVVLDTNVVLDLWLFHDPHADALRSALAQRQLQALVTVHMLDELADVLGRPFARGWPSQPADVLPALLAVAKQVPAPMPLPRQVPRCTDPDDQKFIDLAWCWPARWLISRDRAVLRVARVAHPHGLQISTPANWSGG